MSFLHKILKAMSFTKRLLIGILLLMIAVGIMVFIYVNKDYEGIASQKPEFYVNLTELEKEFWESPETADKKYSGKVLEIAGVFSEIKRDSNAIHLYYKGENYDIDILLDKRIKQTPVKQGKVKALYVGYEPADEDLMLPGIIRFKDGVIK